MPGTHDIMVIVISFFSILIIVFAGYGIHHAATIGNRAAELLKLRQELRIWKARAQKLEEENHELRQNN